jgi:hypothetical protein
MQVQFDLKKFASKVQVISPSTMTGFGGSSGSNEAANM